MQYFYRVYKFCTILFAIIFYKNNWLLVYNIFEPPTRIFIPVKGKQCNSVVLPECSCVYMNLVRQRRGFTIKTAVNSIHPPLFSRNGRSLPLLGFISLKTTREWRTQNITQRRRKRFSERGKKSNKYKQRDSNGQSKRENWKKKDPKKGERLDVGREDSIKEIFLWLSILFT